MATPTPLLSVAACGAEEEDNCVAKHERRSGGDDAEAPTQPSPMALRPSGQGLMLATAMLMKSFMGAASFEFPGALQDAGFVGGCVSTVCFAAMAAYTLILFQKIRVLAHSDLPGPTYAQLGRLAFGRAGSVLVTASIIAMTVGVCSSYLVFTGQVTARLIRFYGNSTNFNSSVALDADTPTIVPWMANFQEWMGLLATLPFVMMLSIVKNIAKLSATSVLGTATVVACMVVIVAKRFTETTITYENWHRVVTSTASFNGFSHFIGNTAFIFCIHSVGVPIERSIRNPKHFPAAVIISTAAVACINLAFGVLCWLLYDSVGVTSDIVDEMDPTSMFLLVVELALCLVMILTYGLFLYPLADEAQQWFKTSFNACQLILFRWLLVAVTVAFALPFMVCSGQTDFSLVTNLTGGVANTMVGIIMPSLIYTKLWIQTAGPTATRGRWIVVTAVHGALALIGVGIVILSTYGTVVPY